jgi:thioredoxin-dependent peroxiredoxin
MALQVGDIVPFFSAEDANGNLFESDSVVGKKSVVIYFYPKDDTRTCTIQACAFRDQYEDFKDFGTEVIGVSSDSVDSHKAFESKYKLPFILLSDKGSKIRKLFGVPKDLLGLIPGRATYVLDKEGLIQLVFDSTSGAVHIKKALEILRNNS